MGAAYERIISSTFALEDPDKAYTALRGQLMLGTRASRADYGEMVDALDAAEENAMRAFELYINAAVDYQSFELDAKIIEGGMREQAVAVLESEKKARKAGGEPTGKAITNDDVEMVMASKFPDEWRDLSGRRARAKHMVDLLKELVERCRERCRDLRAMVNKTRDA